MKRVVISIAMLILVALFLIPLSIITFSRSRIGDMSTIAPHEFTMVLGAGLKPDGTPSDMLRDRLIVATEVYEAKKTKKIIVSGDNSATDYNEPVAMADYLTAHGVPADAILRDYAGLRTYDSCARLKNVWHVDEAIIVTQNYHLYRSLWLCEKLGVASVGVSASLQPYRGTARFVIREGFALFSAWLDINLIHPSFIPGNGKELEEGS
jgi:vancomycin permeability regulator SanA